MRTLIGAVTIWAAIALLLWPQSVEAAPTSPNPAAPSLSPQSQADALALPAGLDLTGVQVTQAVVIWNTDAAGHTQIMGFPTTGSRAVDTAIRARIMAWSLSAAVPPGQHFSSAHAHMYSFPGTRKGTTQDSATGPMVPQAEPLIPASGIRSFPVLANAPHTLGLEMTLADFPGLRTSDVAGRSFHVFWIVDETGTVTDVTVSPGNVPAVSNGIINHFLRLRYLPAVKDGNPKKCRLMHIFEF